MELPLILTLISKPIITAIAMIAKPRIPNVHPNIMPKFCGLASTPVCKDHDRFKWDISMTVYNGT